MEIFIVFTRLSLYHHILGLLAKFSFITQPEGAGMQAARSDLSTNSDTVYTELITASFFYINLFLPLIATLGGRYNSYTRFKYEEMGPKRLRDGPNAAERANQEK